jgi:hypothetical protein
MVAGINEYKIHWGAKLLAFAASVIALSWFFAGWRQVNETQTIFAWLLLFGGIAGTLLLLGLQGYWMYFEEKAKGSLRKRIKLFETIHTALSGGRKD